MWVGRRPLNFKHGALHLLQIRGALLLRKPTAFGRPPGRLQGRLPQSQPASSAFPT